MTVLILGLALFLGLHLVPTVPALRAGLRRRMGVGPYMLSYSLISAVGLGAIIFGYGLAHGAGQGDVQLWVPSPALKHATLGLMLPAFILLAAAYIPSHIRTIVEHPMLTAVILWGLGHLMVRGDLAGVLLFGGFLAFGIVDRVSVMSREAPGPLGQIKGGWVGDIAAVAVGTGAYAAMIFWVHGALIGVSLRPLVGL